MKSVFYSLLVVFSFSLMSCEKQDFNEREGLNNYQSLDKKEGEDEDDEHVVILTVLDQNNLPISGATVHTLTSSTSQCINVSTTDVNGSCNLNIATDNYYFQIYENNTLVYTSPAYDVDSDMTIVHKLP